MNLIVTLLLLTAALVVVVRLLDARRTAGFMALGVLALALAGTTSNRLARLTSHSGSGTLAVAAEASSAPEAAEDEVAEGGDAAAGQARAAASPVSDPAAKGTPPADEGQSLSIAVEAEPGVVVIPPRPSWVESADVRSGDVHTVAVSSGPHETERDCRSYLDRELKRAVDGYVDWYLGRVYGDQFRASTFVSYDLPYIKQNLMRPEAQHHEVIKVSFGPMHQMHALLHFDTRFRQELDGRSDELKRHWREWLVKGRLWGTALGLGTVLALLSVFLGYFRADTATRGFYTGRLQFAAAVVILAIVVAGTLLALRLVT